ncbi:uncharacterized protein KD926_001673 [Aspergillus affinis]|uniref:uncharacterized protein n=1 Tax=Aspergillus affinis TaxID=1070780 RepID=UPI0022FE4A00|nr:uncharacterized protein KD926_001673 [Aspergillus affinis]KAI9036599.1 hypothetical protein KD926_001673 [Aspergillus affinis]
MIYSALEFYLLVSYFSKVGGQDRLGGYRRRMTAVTWACHRSVYKLRTVLQVSGPETAQAGGNTQDPSNNEAPDVIMGSTENADVANEGHTKQNQDAPLPETEAEAEPKPAEEPASIKKKPGLQFLDFLTSPIVELAIGPKEDQTVLTAHQSLLLESPLLAGAVAAFKDSNSRRIELPDENVEAFGYFLQFQYTRNYSAASTGTSTEEVVVGEIDDSGEQLLKHARVYTLAEKLGISPLKTLAHSKIHRINSTSQGEIAYARSFILGDEKSCLASRRFQEAVS